MSGVPAASPYATCDRLPERRRAVHHAAGADDEDHASDASVIERSWAQPDAFAVLFNRYADDIHRYAARRLKVLSRVAATAPESDGEPMADRVAARVSAQSSRAALAGALAKLSARHRDVLLVIAWGDLDYAEAAEALGVPVGTVRSRLRRARTKLRAALGGSDPTALHEEKREETEEHRRG